MGSNLVSGFVAECALKKAYAPIQGSLPKTLPCQCASDHKVVRVDKILVDGSRPHADELRVPEADASKGIRYARKCVDEIKDKLNLNVLTADHHNAGLPPLKPGWIFSHDLLCVEDGCSFLDSVELKVRAVKTRKPRTFNWQKVLESEAEPLWNAELDQDASPWRRRVLVLVEIIPDSGEVRGVHVSALDKGRKKWYTISGWEGFWSRDDGDEPDPEPLLRIAPCARAPADGPSAAQLRCLSRKFRAEGVHDEHDDSWVPLACFLRAVGKAKEVAQA